MASHATDPDTQVAKFVPKRRYRPDLHGIRGLALLGVVLFHLFGNGKVSGGIDIFLAVSGFLFTAMLLREATENNGRINLLKYFGRLFRRIFAPAAVVIITTTVAALYILPFTGHNQMLREAIASLLYYENFELINSQLTYDAAGPDTSVFQHFWSLSVQGQFYLIIPAIIMALVWGARKRNHPAVFWVGAALVAILLASGTWAIILNAQLPNEAYLSTATRLWQLAFGGLLAIVIDHLRIPNQLRFILGWLGIAMIVSTGFIFDGGQQFPGLLALWPLLGLAAVLLAAPQTGTAPAASVTRLLNNPVFNWIGDLSYTLYLWHWPLLIFYLTLKSQEELSIIDGLIVLAATIVLSVALNMAVERPMQRWGSRATTQTVNTVPLVGGLLVMLVFTQLGTQHLLATQHEQQPRSNSTYHLDAQTYPGALATLPDAAVVPEVEHHQPHGAQLASVEQEYVTRGCRQEGRNTPGSFEVILCEDDNTPQNPAATIVLAPDSHAGHWEQTFRTLAEQHNWELIIAIKSGCNFSGIPGQPGDDYCHQWNDNFVSWLETQDLDLVIAPGTRMYGRPANESFAEGAQLRWQQIESTQTPLLLIRGTIRPGTNIGVADCLAVGNPPQECGGVAGDAAKPNPIEYVELAATTKTIDMNPYICPAVVTGPDGVCSAVVGNTAVWYDNSHLTPQYAASLAPMMETKLREKFPALFE